MLAVYTLMISLFAVEGALMGAFFFGMGGAGLPLSSEAVGEQFVSAAPLGAWLGGILFIAFGLLLLQQVLAAGWVAILGGAAAALYLLLFGCVSINHPHWWSWVTVFLSPTGLGFYGFLCAMLMGSGALLLQLSRTARRPGALH